MPLITYLKPETTLLLQGGTRDEVLKELIQVVCRSHPDLNPDSVERVVAHREEELNTHIAQGIALPHGRVAGMDGFAISLGLSPSGVPWGPEANDEPVHLVVLVLGDESRAEEHIRILGQIAAMFSQPGMIKRLMACEDSASLYRHLTDMDKDVSGSNDGNADTQNLAILQHASQLAETLSASSVIVLGPRHVGRYLRRLDRSPNRPWVLAAPATPRDRAQDDLAFDAVIDIPSRGLMGRQQVDVVILIGLLNGVIQLEEVAVCVYAREEAGKLDTVHVVDLRHEFGELVMAGHEIRNSDIEPEVLYRVLQLGNELAVEGREGHPIGTLFTLGDYEHVANYTHQIVMNPFHGYAADEKNILDPSLAETLKEFSLLDGAFVVRGDGEVMSAGTCVQIHTPTEAASGLGTRHAAGHAISAATRALGIVVSQSTGTVSVYRSGRCILALTRSHE